MEVRRAKLEDMAKIMDFLEDYHKSSRVKDVKFRRPDMVKVVETYIRNAGCFPGSAWDDKGELIGLLFGSVEPFMHNKQSFWATDLFFISRGAGPALLRNFKEWARVCGASRIIMGVSSDNYRADQLLELTEGFEPVGGMYECRLS